MNRTVLIIAGVVAALAVAGGLFAAKSFVDDTTARAERVMAEAGALDPYLRSAARTRSETCQALAAAVLKGGRAEGLRLSATLSVLKSDVGPQRCAEYRLAAQLRERRLAETARGKLTAYRSEKRLLILDQAAHTGELFTFGPAQTAAALQAAEGAPGVLTTPIEIDDVRCLFTMEHFAIGLPDITGGLPATADWRFEARPGGAAGIANGSVQMTVTRAAGGGIASFTLHFPGSPAETYQYVQGPHMLMLC